MTDLPELVILDIGHGNSAVLRDTNGVVIIDCACGPTLIDLLEQLGITTVTHILISHADADHIAGITTLLYSEKVSVQSIYLNPDAVKKSEIWEDFRTAVRFARQRGKKVETHTELTSTLRGVLNVGLVNINILGPTPELAMSGVGGHDSDGRRLTANSMSVVIRLEHEGQGVALLAGDIDVLGLIHLRNEGVDLSANVLVFPHHGGNPGSGAATDFAREVCKYVNPSAIIFSNDRSRFLNPREGIVRGVKDVVPKAHIICTQLSVQCATELPLADYKHLENLPAKGRAGTTNQCCGGTIVLSIDGSRSTIRPLIDAHAHFVATHTTTPICLRAFQRE